MQSWTKWLLISAVSVGGVFELAKRLNWLPAIDPTVQQQVVQTPETPYARSNVPLHVNHRIARHRDVHMQPQKTRPSSLVIPPNQGKFDTHAGAKPADKKNEKKIEKTAKKETDDQEKPKCRKRDDVYSTALNSEYFEQQTPDRAKNEETEKTAEQHQGEEELPFCDQEDVAKKDEKDAEPSDEEVEEPEYDTLYGGGGIAVVSPENPEDALAGLDEWKKLLLERPNFKETVRLIEMYQTGRIRPELFYAVVKLMLESHRREIKELGILAAGRTPSYDSYHLLISVIKHESFGSPFRIKAEAELNFYIQLNFLGVLENVLRNSNDVFAIVYATKKLDESAKRYLSSNYKRDPKASKHPYAKYYQRFIALLTTLSSSPDNQQANQARQTLLSLQDLLKV